jgi:hypothetical protein
MINYTRAFDLAWERMMVMLFRPFDLGKWCAIGFSAFLAGLLAGGNGVNGSFNWNQKSPWPGNFGGSFNSNFSNNFSNNLNSFNSSAVNVFAGMQTGVIILLVALGCFLVFGVVVLMYWLGARGQFLLLDNVVRNRGAIAWPWRTYARQGNSLFGFYLLYLLLITICIIPLTVLGVFAALPLIREHRWPEGGELALAAVFGLVYLAILFGFSVVLFLFRELGVPLMFRRGLLARAAFDETWRLVRRHPGSMAAFVLLRIALFLGLLVVSVIVCCASCCFEVIPYVGTVLLLPALLYIKCFTLDFLAQFGPDYDVWTVDVPPAAEAPAVNPPPPPE